MRKTDSFRVGIGGHRGSGCTDSEWARSNPLTHGKPPENTIPSIVLAFENGADYVEFDAVPTGDGRVVVLHSVKKTDHFFGPQDFDSVSNAPWSAIAAASTGPRQSGKVPLLAEALEAIASRAVPERMPFLVNVEIKDAKGTIYPRPDNFMESVLSVVRNGPLPMTRVLFSSFSLRDLIDLRQMDPAARTGMLFVENSAPEEEIYLCGSGDPLARYLHFTPRNLEIVMKHVLPDFLHPERNSITLETAAMVKSCRTGLNAWAFEEPSPATDRKAVEKILELCIKESVPISLITDYVPEMKSFLLEGGWRP